MGSYIDKLPENSVFIIFGYVFNAFYYINNDYVFQIIDDILSRNLLPIIVGGTNYYIQVLACIFVLLLLCFHI